MKGCKKCNDNCSHLYYFLFAKTLHLLHFMQVVQWMHYNIFLFNPPSKNKIYIFLFNPLTHKFTTKLFILFPSLYIFVAYVILLISSSISFYDSFDFLFKLYMYISIIFLFSNEYIFFDFTYISFEKREGFVESALHIWKGGCFHWN